MPEEYVTNQAKRKIVMDVTEIAEIMGCPVGTVTYRLSVARAKIKEGVLQYEKRNDDKLYAFAGVPFLTSLLAAEMQGLAVPDIFPNIISAAAVVGGGIAAAVIISNKKDDGSDSGITAGMDTESSTEGTTAEDTQVYVASDKETTEEATAGTEYINARWLLQQDFSAGRLEKAPADFTLFYERLATPVSVDDIKQSFDAAAHPANADTIRGSAEEVLSSDASFYHTSGYSDYGKVFIYDKGTEYNVSIAKMGMYNVSGQAPSIAECVSNNWWSIYADEYIDKYSFPGYDEADIPSGDKGIMEALIQDLGSPNYLHIGITREEFIAEAEKGNNLDMYILGWVFDDYVLEVFCMVHIFSDWW